jgi:hypothetical protein
VSSTPYLAIRLRHQPYRRPEAVGWPDISRNPTIADNQILTLSSSRINATSCPLCSSLENSKPFKRIDLPEAVKTVAMGLKQPSRTGAARLELELFRQHQRSDYLLCYEDNPRAKTRKSPKPQPTFNLYGYRNERRIAHPAKGHPT